MASSRAEALLRKPGQQRGISYQELFFDLVFVFALTQLSQWLLQGLTSQPPIALAGQALVLLLALLLLWSGTAWITDLYDPQRPETQLMVGSATFGVLVMAVVLPEAFGSQGLVFAVAYVAIPFSRGLILVPALRGHPARHRVLGVQLWYGIAAVPWIVGAISGTSTRTVCWALAICIEYTGANLFFPAPWIRRPLASRWPVVPEHMAERYQQFFVIVLGELVAITGATEGATDLTSASRGAAFFISFATTVLLWLTYLYRAGTLLPAAIAAVPAPARLVRAALLAHMIMVAGVVAADAGFELAIAQPLGHTDPAWIGLIVGGPTAFLAGRILFGHTVFGRVSRPRVIAALLLGGAAPAMILVPPLAVTTTVAAVLAYVVASDVILARGRSPIPPSPRL